jgi:hypothetical protein
MLTESALFTQIIPESLRTARALAQSERLEQNERQAQSKSQEQTEPQKQSAQQKQSEPHAGSTVQPQQTPTADLALFRAHTRELCALLARQGNDPTWYCQSFNPYPLAISVEHFQTQKRLQSLLYKALTKIVENYFQDQLLQKWLDLPEPVFAALAKLADKPFCLGSYRPDFLHTTDNSIAICEINARFPANAYFISYYLNNVIGATEYLNHGQQAGLARTNSSGDALTVSDSTLSPFAGISHTVELFNSIFADHKNIYSLYKREKGWDRHFFEYELTAKGHDLVSPASLAALADALLNGTATSSDWTNSARHSRAGADSAGTYSVGHSSAGTSGVETDSGGKTTQTDLALFLELHQDELTDHGLLDFVCSNFDRLTCFNDPRTIFIVHDKRMLSILCDREKLSAYMTGEEADFLSRHIVPTWTIKDSQDKVEEAMRNSDQFVLKPNLLGKGEGMLFGATTETEQFRSALQDERCSHFILQTFVPQKKHDIYMEIDKQLVQRQVNIVGTLLCFDDELLGPGIYRASPSDIVNVAGGGAILVPMLAT